MEKIFINIPEGYNAKIENDFIVLTKQIETPKFNVGDVIKLSVNGLGVMYKLIEKIDEKYVVSRYGAIKIGDSIAISRRNDKVIDIEKLEYFEKASDDEVKKFKDLFLFSLGKWFSKSSGEWITLQSGNFYKTNMGSIVLFDRVEDGKIIAKCTCKNDELMIPEDDQMLYTKITDELDLDYATNDDVNHLMPLLIKEDKVLGILGDIINSKREL